MAASTNLTPEQRAQRARLGAHALFANTDPVEHTKPARTAFLARFESEVDPDGTLDPPSELVELSTLARRTSPGLPSHRAGLALVAAGHARVEGMLDRPVERGRDQWTRCTSCRC
jgi:hypothetical protein